MGICSGLYMYCRILILVFFWFYYLVRIIIVILMCFKFYVCIFLCKLGKLIFYIVIEFLRFFYFIYRGDIRKYITIINVKCK